jgi:predicted alpha/beta superfamily hydrolase
VHEGFDSRQAGNTRRLTVWLPPGYAEAPRRRYPVLYVHDGQNLFDERRAYAGQAWRLGDTAGRLVAAGRIAPLVIVGIDHAGERRIEEFTPTRDPRRGAGGGADGYACLLVEHIKPFIDREYRTRPGAAHTAVGGSSMGGLVTLHIGLRHPRTFTRLAVVSPSVWWDDRAIVRAVEALPGPLPLRVWLDIGTAEGRGALRDARALCRALERKGWRRGENLRCVEATGAEHAERAWAARAGAMLQYLFPPEAPPTRRRRVSSRGAGGRDPR